jgi:peptidoglycan-associated lipoprotein
MRGTARRLSREIIPESALGGAVRIVLRRADMMRATLPAVLGVLLLACHSPEPTSPESGLTNAVQPPRPPDLGKGAPRIKVEGAYSMYVADPVRNVCSGSVPFFEFDSSDTREGDQPTMQALAECMTKGPLLGKAIKLIGHTDPRGTPNYNEKLGLERAERVKRYLVGHGVDAARVQVESLGEDQASAAPKDWPKDRRVEVQLVR